MERSINVKVGFFATMALALAERVGSARYERH